jgi:pilus assembly protein Flp/PilA
MRRWLQSAERFLSNEDGPTAVEYAIMLALIIIVCFTTIVSLGSSTKSSFANPQLNSTLSGS